MGSFIVEKGTSTHCPPGFGMGTARSRWLIFLSIGMSDVDPDSKWRCVKKRRNSVQ